MTMIKIIPLNKTSRNFYLSNVRTYDLKKNFHLSNHESQQNCYIVSFCIKKKLDQLNYNSDRILIYFITKFKWVKWLQLKLNKLKFCFSVFIVTEIQIFADRTKYIKYIIGHFNYWIIHKNENYHHNVWLCQYLPDIV